MGITFCKSVLLGGSCCNSTQASGRCLSQQITTSMGFLAVAVIVSATSVMSALLTQKD